jgi:hypothetical protein
VDKLAELRTLAIRQKLGEIVGADFLVAAALRPPVGGCRVAVLGLARCAMIVAPVGAD